MFFFIRFYWIRKLGRERCLKFQKFRIVFLLDDLSLLISNISIRAYFRKIKRAGIGRFIKKCPFRKEIYFLI